MANTNLYYSDSEHVILVHDTPLMENTKLAPPIFSPSLSVRSS
jgi:hypothetical protein